MEAQDQDFNEVESKVEEAAVESHKAGETIKEASQTKFKTYKWKVGAFFGGIGAAVGAFFGAVPGAAAGGVGGGVLGAGMGKGIEKGG